MTNFHNAVKVASAHAPRPVTDVEIDAFVQELHAAKRDEHQARYNHPSPEWVITSRGTKYVRIVSRRVGEQHGSAYAFIERATGHILKPASYAAPAKHPRGNITATDRLDCCGLHGVAYIAR